MIKSAILEFIPVSQTQAGLTTELKPFLPAWAFAGRPCGLDNFLFKKKCACIEFS